MRIGIDIDGVLTDFAGPFLQWYNQQHGTNHSFDSLREYELTTTLSISEEYMRERMDAFYDTLWFKHLNPSPYTQEEISLLHMQHTLVVITARPYKLEARTRSWLERFFPRRFSEFIFANHYAQEGAARDKPALCQEANLDIVIDDWHACAATCAQKGIRTLVFNQPWNQKPMTKGMRRVHSWREIGDILHNGKT